MGTGKSAVGAAALGAGRQNEESDHNRDCSQTLHAAILRQFSNLRRSFEAGQKQKPAVQELPDRSVHTRPAGFSLFLALRVQRRGSQCSNQPATQDSHPPLRSCYAGRSFKSAAWAKQDNGEGRKHEAYIDTNWFAGVRRGPAGWAFGPAGLSEGTS